MNVFCIITAEKGTRVPLTVENDWSPTQLRKQISAATKIPLEQLRLIFMGRMIKDDEAGSAVELLKLKEDCVIHCMGKPASAPSDATTSFEGEVGSLPSASPAVAPPPPAAAAIPMINPVVSPTTTPPNTTTLREALRTLQTSNSSADYQTAVSTLDKILDNIMENPMEQKYRQLKASNDAFGKRLGNVPGGRACLESLGFSFQGGIYQLEATPEAWNQLTKYKTQIETALRAATSSPNLTSPMLGNNLNNPMLNPGIHGNNNNNHQAMISNLLSNPEALRTMMQNPLVREMMQNDPNLPPAMRESMREIVNYPAMLEQMVQMMQSPGMQQQVARAVQQQQQQQPLSAPSQPANNTSNNNDNSGTNDQDQTEDEMIAEAIRRSLED